VSGATVTFNPAATLTSLGTTLTITNGTVNFNSGEALSVASYSHSGGTLAGSDNLAITSGGTWSGGTMSGSGTTTVNSGATLALNTATLTLSRTLTNQGTVNHTVNASNGGTVTFQGGTINNAGAYNLTTAGGSPMQNTSGTNLFANSGTFSISVSA